MSSDEAKKATAKAVSGWINQIADGMARLYEEYTFWKKQKGFFAWRVRRGILGNIKNMNRRLEGYTELQKEYAKRDLI